jgi:hypothetical protein
MQQPSRKHHFIPAFYLKNWMDQAGSLVEYSRPRDTIKPQRRHANATGYQRDLYSFSDLPTDIAHVLETKFFKRTDEIADKVLSRLLSGDLNIYEPKQRSGWSRFLVSLQLRHPDVVVDLRKDIARMLTESDEALETSYQKIRNASDPPTFKEYTLAVGHRSRLALYALQGVMDNRLGGQHLNNLRWGTLRVDKAACPLLTSDWPLNLNADGLGIVLLPLSPRCLFIAAPTVEMLQEVSRRRADDVVSLINAYTVGHARQYVFASDELQARFVENRMSKRMRPRPLFPLLGL